MAEALKPIALDIPGLIQFAERGIVSKTLYESPSVKLVLFCFEQGQALSEHAAPFEAVIQVIEGAAELRLGGEPFEAKPGALYVMPPGLKHAVTAKGRLVFLLTMVKPAVQMGRS